MSDGGVDHTVLHQHAGRARLEREHPDPTAVVEHERAPLGEGDRHDRAVGGLDDVAQLPLAGLADLKGHRTHPEPEARRARRDGRRDSQGQPAAPTSRRTAGGGSDAALRRSTSSRNAARPRPNLVARAGILREELANPRADVG